MAEYIEREALLDSICHEMCRIAFCGATNCAFMAKVCSAPSANVAPVVHCKDCEHAFINGFGNESGVVLCKLLSSCENVVQVVRQFDDFCSYGERKDGGDNNAKSM